MNLRELSADEYARIRQAARLIDDESHWQVQSVALEFITLSAGKLILKRLRPFVMEAPEKPVHLVEGPAMQLGIKDYLVIDGNHRVFGAFIRRDKKIVAKVFRPWNGKAA